MYGRHTDSSGLSNFTSAGVALVSIQDRNLRADLFNIAVAITINNMVDLLLGQRAAAEAFHGIEGTLFADIADVIWLGTEVELCRQTVVAMVSCSVAFVALAFGVGQVLGLLGGLARGRFVRFLTHMIDLFLKLIITNSFWVCKDSAGTMIFQEFQSILSEPDGDVRELYKPACQVLVILDIHNCRQSFQ